MKSYLLVALLTVLSSTIGWAQDNSGPKSYLSVSAETFVRTSTLITGSGKPELESTFLPGITFGLEYSHVSKTGLTYETGLRFGTLPFSYKYSANPADFDGPFEWTNIINDRVATYGYGHLYVPIQFGYTAAKNHGTWVPAVLGGLSFHNLYSFSYFNSLDVGERSGTVRIFNFEVTSPVAKSSLWISYTLNARVSRTLKTGNLFSLGLLCNLSGKNIYEGRYAFYPKGRIHEGQYTDKGNYVGFEIGYSFLQGKRRINN